MDIALQLIVFLPLLAAIVAGLGGRLIGNFGAKLITTGALVVGAALSWPIFLDYLAGNAQPMVIDVAEFIKSGDLDVTWALRVDALTAVMLVVVTTVSSLVHLYSWGYMAEDPSQPRFFAYLSLFSFAMLMLVTADSLVQMFFGWEGVGLASYLLIGFWYHKPSANAAALKAFVVNRVGDFGFSLGIFGTFLVFGTVSIPAILEASPGMAGATIGFAGMRVDTMTLLCLLLFVGAMGKSAQLGLHTWLPDAMEGPTPVSALIHAATMVTAGVFMVCRLSPMFEAAPDALTVVTYVGAATAIFAATVGTVQNDIKRVIAYSTCSQLGYMFFAAGVGAYGAAMFHLFTHAFFKALLFLGAGSVIHAMHHEQDMRFYGALRKEIPFTFWAMIFGTLAITGVGIWGLGFAGYWSKDAILESAFASGSVHGNIAFWLGAFAALLTSFYSWRLIFLTFFGKARWAGSEHIQHAVHHVHEDAGEIAADHDSATDHEVKVKEGTAGYHPHESPWTILVPLALLSLGAIAAGQLFHGWFVEAEQGAAFWRGSLAFDEHLAHAMHEVPTWVKWSPFVVMLIGLFIAWICYTDGDGEPVAFWPRRENWPRFFFIWFILFAALLPFYILVKLVMVAGSRRSTANPAAFVAMFPHLHRFLMHKWYFDELYGLIFVRPAMWLGNLLWRKGDEGTIDRFGPHGAAYAVGFGNRYTARLQSGYVYSYALVMLLGLIAAASWAFWWA